MPDEVAYCQSIFFLALIIIVAANFPYNMRRL
jgi:hypothetical protein